MSLRLLPKNLFGTAKADQLKRGETAVSKLQGLLGAALFSDLLLKVPDRRELFEAAARECGIEEFEILDMIAPQLGTAAARKVESIVLSLLPPSLELSLLRSAGCIPQMTNEKITKLVCVDPGFVQPVTQITGAVLLEMGSWRQIRGALDASEARALNRKFEELSAEDKNLATRAFQKLVAQVWAFKARQFSLTRAKGAISYCFDTPERKQGHGDIKSEIGNLIWAYAESLLAPTKPTVSEESFAGALRFNVKQESDTELTISWHSPILDIGAANEAAIRPENSDEPRLELVQPVEEQREKQRSKILVIDDNPTFGRVLERFFSRQEFDVTHVVEAEEALKVLAQSDSHIDLVICDIHMPKMDGHEFLKRLKAMPGHADLPVIMLTSDNDIEVKLKLLGNGADALLTKNEDPRLLCSHVKSLLSRRRIDQAVK